MVIRFFILFFSFEVTSFSSDFAYSSHFHVFCFFLCFFFLFSYIYIIYHHYHHRGRYFIIIYTYWVSVKTNVFRWRSCGSNPSEYSMSLNSILANFSCDVAVRLVSSFRQGSYFFRLCPMQLFYQAATGNVYTFILCGLNPLIFTIPIWPPILPSHGYVYILSGLRSYHIKIRTKMGVHLCCKFGWQVL